MFSIREQVESILTEREIKKLEKLDGLSLTNFCNIYQPKFAGTVMTIRELTDMSEAFSQFPVNPANVKRILFATNTGFLNTNLLLEPVILGQVEANADMVIVSGRHRIAAIAFLTEYFNLELSSVPVRCVIVTYKDIKQVALGTISANQTRTMTGTEKLNIRIEGAFTQAINSPETAYLYSIKGRSRFKEAFKLYSVNYIRENIIPNLESGEEHKVGLTLDTLGIIFGKVAQHIIDNEKEFYVELTSVSGGEPLWTSFGQLLINLVDEGLLEHNGKNIKRTSIPTYVKGICEYIHEALKEDETSEKD